MTFPYIVGSNIKCYWCSGKKFGISSKSTSLPRYLSIRTENRYTNRNLGIDVPSTIDNSQKVETTLMSINWWMGNKVWYSHVMKCLWTIKGKCRNMDQPWTRNAKWKKPDMKGHILCEISHRHNTERQKSQLVAAGRKGRWGDSIIRMGFPLGMIKVFWN